MSIEDKLESGGRHVRWNLTALLLDVTFFALGMAFLDGSAVLPLLLERLGASGRLIGGAAAVRSLAFSAFQILVAYRLHGKPRQKPWLVLVATASRLPLLCLPWFIIHAADSPQARARALWASILLLSFWALGDGLGYIPWMEIVARAFPTRLRGRFFASSQMLSGVGSIAIGLVVVRIILNSTRISYPANYAVLACSAAILFHISLLGVMLIREPEIAISERFEIVSANLAAYFRRIPKLLTGNPTFVKLAAIQLLLGFGAASAPFYVLYAARHFHLGDQWGGVYQAMQAVGVVALTPVWTLLAEKFSAATAVRALAFAVLLTPLLALTAGTSSPMAFASVFVLMGGSLGWGLWIVMNHYLLSHVAEHERPVFVALINLVFAPSALFPYFGGMLVVNDVLIQYHGVPILFAITAGVVLLGFILSLRLAHIQVE